MNNINNNFQIGQVKPGLVKITYNGDLAISTNNGTKYMTYDIKTNSLTDVTGFTMDIIDNAVFAVPCNKVSKGDIVLISGKPKCVLSTDNNVIEVIDFESQQVVKVIPERHLFLGKTVFITKIVSAFSGGDSKNMMKFMMMSQMLNNQGQNNLLPFMLMSNGSMFDNMFTNIFEEDNEDGNSTEESHTTVRKGTSKID